MFSLIDLPFTYAIGSHPPQLKGHHQVSPGHAEARYVFDRLLSYLCVLGYIGDFEIVDDHRSGKIVINLLGRLNKCGVISPRFDVTLDKIEQLASDLLPLVSSVTSSSLPLTVSWTTRRLVASTPVVRSSDSSSKCNPSFLHHPPTQRRSECLLAH